MVTTLAIDVGSSSVKAGVLLGTTPVGVVVREEFRTSYDGVRAEVHATDVIRAVSRAAKRAVRSAVGKPADVVALSCMSPSWVAMDKWGDALTPVVTHQDRRALEQARAIEKVVGKKQHLRVTGNRPVPGGISSTTAMWFAMHEKGAMRRARFVGHLQTLLLARWTGVAAMDPSNASFTGFWRTCENEVPCDGSSNWEPGLVELAGLKVEQMPRVFQGDAVAGTAHSAGARELGVKSGTAVITGVVDTSAAFLLAGARPGMLINNAGSTDVLGVVLEEPRPDERYLTRALGVGGKWVAVTTIPAAGSAVVWARKTLFADLTDKAFFELLHRVAERVETDVTCDLDLGGSRISVEQPSGAFRNLRLSTTREEMLAALLDALAERSAERLELLRHAVGRGGRIRREVLRTGGTGAVLADVLYRGWKGKWAFADVPEATLLGLGQLAAGRCC